MNDQTSESTPEQRKIWSKPVLESFDIAIATRNFGGPNMDDDHAESS